MPVQTAVPLSPAEDSDPTCLCHEANREYDAGHYTQAKQLYERYVARLEETQGPKGYDVARMLQMVGSCYRHQFKYREAENTIKRSIAILEATRQDDDPELASALSGLANVFSDEKLYGEAIKHAEKAVDILSKASHPDSSELSYSLFVLAYALDEAGQDIKAEETYLRAIKIREQDPAMHDKDLAYLLGNLSHIYMRREQYDKADPLLEEKVSLGLTLVKTNPTILESAAHALATCYDRRGKHDKADRMYDLLTKDVSDKAGERSNALALISHNAGNRLIDQYKFAEAIPYCRRSVEIRTRDTGPTRVDDLVIDLNNLALCYFRCNQYAEAEPVCKQVVETLVKHPSKDSAQLETAFKNYEKVLRKLGKTAEADQIQVKQKNAVDKSP